MNTPIDDIVLQVGGISDLPQILEIVNFSIENETSNYSYEPMSMDDIMDWFMDLQNNNCPLIVARKGHEVLGYANYSQFRKKIGYQFCMEHSVYVHQNHQGKGLGRMLLEEIIKLAKANEIHTLVAGIDTKNPGSIAFHKQMGFKEVGLLKEVGFKFDQWLDLVFMQKNLD